MKSVNKPFAEMQKKTLESLEPLQNMNAGGCRGVRTHCTQELRPDG